MHWSCCATAAQLAGQPVASGLAPLAAQRCLTLCLSLPPCRLQVSGVELMDGSYSQDLHDRATGFSGWQP